MNKLRKTWDLLKKLMKIFFGGDDFEQTKEKGKKSLTWAVIYRSGQWGLVVLVGSCVTAVQKVIELGYMDLFPVLLIGNTLITGKVIKLNNETDVDFTFMEGLRNVLKEAFEVSILIGIVFETISFLILLIWSGADQFIIFFEERFTSSFSKLSIFLLASCCSMAIWTHVYLGFATGFWDLIDKLWLN